MCCNFKRLIFMRIRLPQKYTTAFLLFNCLFFSSLYAQTNTFNGATSTNWNTATNWSLNAIPTAAHSVIIPDNFSVTVNTAAVCNSLTIKTGANNNTVTISGITDPKRSRFVFENGANAKRTATWDVRQVLLIQPFKRFPIKAT